jgi:hypothetical protein
MCKRLTSIRTAKILHLNNQTIHSNNKIKTTWNIIRTGTVGNNNKYDKVNIVNTDKENSNNVNVEIFNKYFLTIDENISCQITGSNKQIISCAKYSLSYLFQVFHFPFNNIVFHKTSTGEIKKLFTPSHGKTLVWV